jgi:flagellar protein FlbD
MIRLTRLNKQPIGVNSDLVKFVENSPDTLITLITGEKILVLETYEEIVSLIVAFRQRVLSGVDHGCMPGAEALRRAGTSSRAIVNLPEKGGPENPPEIGQDGERP